MNRWCVAGLLLLIFSLGCSGWETKKVSSEALFTEAWEAIALTEVDTYPMFKDCDQSAEKTIQRQCFETVVLSSLQEHLKQYPIATSTTLNDTMNVHFVVDEKGIFCIDSLTISSHIKEALPDTELWIYNGIKEIPEVIAATKRGIPVKVQFQIPIVFDVQ